MSTILSADPRAVLRELEWSGEDGTECLRCGWPRESAHHHPQCDLAAALREPDAPEPLIPPEFSSLAVTLEHVLEQVQKSGPNRSCPVCVPNGFGLHADDCPVAAVLHALPGREGGPYLTVRRRARDLPRHWPRPVFEATNIMFGCQQKLVEELVPGRTLSAVLSSAVVRTMNGAEVEHDVTDLALVGDTLTLLLGRRTRQAGFLNDQERREARRSSTTRGKHGND